MTVRSLGRGLPTSKGGATLVRDPEVIDFAAEAFERFWDTALPFPYEYSRE
ncbi:hypothetical protein ABZW18_33345 [Streptomyces sp. NPDC004647]|uniref:hypothetical protein n=1 Tax=Streptomyces sp. NPDC004647 TaxID=3154671 RepID=UPI0033A288C2